MSKLSDLVPPRHRVTLQLGNGEPQDVDVCGLSIPDITTLIERYPDMVAQFDGKFDASSLLKMGPQAIGAVLAMACGAPNDRAAEAALVALPLGTVVELLDIVAGETMPNGVGPFVSLAKRFGLDLASVLQKIPSPNLAPSESISLSATDTTLTS
jgi:hypothetical protein